MDQLNKDWTNLPKEHNLSKFSAALKDIIEKVGYSEMYGVELVAPSTEDKPAPHTTLIVLQKFLRANVDDLEKAKEQLTSALKWRKEYQPLKVRDEVYDKDKFGGLGFVTKVKGATETKNEEDVVSWNIYGAAAKDVKKTFGDTDAFVRWRVALQEITIQQLKLNEATETIPDYGKGPDPYKAINVHDYLSVSFFRRPQEIKDSSSKIIDMFQRYYPETVSYKYFVNVPLVMQWMMGAMKALMSKDSIQTMTWMTYGSELHKYLGSEVPKEYGGSGAPLAEHALTPNYGAGAAAAPVESKIAEPVPTTAEPVEPKAAEPVPIVNGSETTAEVTGKPADKADVA
ncbi:hypothetical protein M409DRAFT_65798 [Zasmidium cellare ATCC 36951]|uniref:Phosphatidylinositol transfer protein SFH5 n=1 Tax=Zasmidium cellare ATCC 36951 TaxID=1080233 RepID=A0A6A6CNE5_ZASCE|nr:uncharacterized protein M409DRAFT_65798 [Zasmidium cellare ATCC 36951]KAF2167660.1 hypothetical protein M409DRAFT_65798 [Zasmidium cellare ATCC 36951]